MSHNNQRDLPLNRRSWMALAVSALAGCGGGMGGISVAGGPPGTGGTGIYAQGSISGFGSVIINGIKFDDTAASVQLNGAPSVSADLRLGMVASVQGQRGADLRLGVASQIEVWSIAQGPVSQVQSGQFLVAGMVVQTNTATVFDGVGGTAALVTGMQVAVWGLQARADGNRWTATRVARVTDAFNAAVVSSGLVVTSGSQQTLNGMVLTGALASGLAAGQLVRVQGTLSGTTLSVAAVRQLDLQAASRSDGDLEIEGLVTAVPSATRFMLGDVEVDAASAVFSTPGVPVSVGMRVQVEGGWLGQVLKAVKVEFEGELALDVAEIDGQIQSFTSIANFVIRGQRCNATGATISNGLASDLQVGVKIKVTGNKAGDVLNVTRIEFDR